MARRVEEISLACTLGASCVPVRTWDYWCVRDWCVSQRPVWQGTNVSGRDWYLSYETAFLGGPSNLVLTHQGSRASLLSSCVALEVAVMKAP